MFAISFDLSISDLETYYGTPYNKDWSNFTQLIKE